MRRSSRAPGRAFRISKCCICEDNESETAAVPSTAPAGPRPGQTTRLTPRTEVGLGGVGGPVARLPPGLQVRDGASRRRSRALIQTGISEATLVAGSQRSDIELNETHPPTDQVTPAELPINPASPVEEHPRPSSLISPTRDPPTQGAHQDSLAPSPGDRPMQDETHRRCRRSLNIVISPPVHDTRHQRRRSLAMENLPAEESRLEAPGQAGGPTDRSVPDERRQRRRRSSQIGSSRRLESPVTGPEGHSSAPQETRQSRRRSLHVDNSPRRPELRQHRRRLYLQNPPQPGEDSDTGRLANPPLGVEHLFPQSPSLEQPKDGDSGDGKAEKG